jgi:NitT/TauT family transport system substrate-binding protein
MSHERAHPLDRATASLASCAGASWVAFAALILVLLAPRAARAEKPTEPERVAVVVPEPSNLQLLAFWVAKGAGYFANEGIAIEVTSGPSPALAQSLYTQGAAPFAVLPAPDFERLIAEGFAFELVANLLANDPIDLVMKRATAASHGIDRAMPLAARLRALRGIKLGVAPHPRTRLTALFASQGLDANALDVHVLRGDEQNGAFAAGEVDALYAHTPFLERAILDDDAIVIVDQAGGEVPALTHRQIHALVVTRAFAKKEPRVVASMVRAIARAEALVHSDQDAATDAILRAVRKFDRAHVAKLVALYAPAVPATPAVSAAKITRELAFYPSGGPAPDLSKIDLAPFVYRAPAATGGSRGAATGSLLGLMAAFTLLVAGAAASVDQRNSARKSSHDTSV